MRLQAPRMRQRAYAGPARHQRMWTITGSWRARLRLGCPRRFQQAVPRFPVLWAAVVAGPANLVLLLPQVAGMEHMRAESGAGVLRDGACGESSAFAAVSSGRWQLQKGAPGRSEGGGGSDINSLTACLLR